MLNDQQLEDYFNRLRLSSEARALIRHIRKSPPSRRVKSGARNISCRFASIKMGLTVQTESQTNELAAVYLWEHDPNILEFWDQPPAIRKEFKNKRGAGSARYDTPDFFILHSDWAGWVECKTEKWLRDHQKAGKDHYRHDQDGGWHCPAAEPYASKLGLRFLVRSSDENNATLVRNLNMLSDYLDARCKEPDPQAVALAQQRLQKSPWLTLRALTSEQPAIPADVVMTMIAKGTLSFDLENELLAEPELAHVFRDRTTADVYRSHIRERVAAAIAPIPMQSGTRLTWDGVPWCILNVGVSEVLLKGPNDQLEPLTHEVFEKLVTEARIAGVDTAPTTREQAALEIIQHASAHDLDRAQKRYHWLYPQPNSEPCPHSGRSMRQWRAWWREGEGLYGSGFLGIVGREHRRGNRTRRLDPEVLKIMDAVIKEWVQSETRRHLTICWGDVVTQCEASGLPAPSEKAFRAEVARRPKHEMTSAREGEKAAYESEEFFWHLESHTPKHGDRAFEIGHIDHTELDLALVGRRFGRKLTGRVWLTLIVDAFTRMVLAWYMTFDPPSYRTCMSVLRNCVQRHGRIPRTLVVDGGSEFGSKYFEQLLSRLESHKRSRPAGKPRHGTLIERNFGMTNTQFVHNLVGNTQASRQPRSMSPSHNPRKHAIWTLAEFSRELDGYFDKRNQSYEQAATGMTATALYAASEEAFGRRGHTLLPWSEELAFCFMPAAKSAQLKVHAGRGVKFREVYYWSEVFRAGRLQSTKLEFRYDPFDVSTAYVWIRATKDKAGEWVKVQSEHAAAFRGRSEREIHLATLEIYELQTAAGRRRKLNAAMLAEYLRKAQVTERRLQQQWHDEERVEAEAAQPEHETSNPIAAACATKTRAARKSTQTARKPNPWAQFQQRA